MYGDSTYGWFEPTDDALHEDKDKRRRPVYQLDRWDLEVRWLDASIPFDLDVIVYKEDIRKLRIETDVSLDLIQLGTFSELSRKYDPFTLRKLYILKHNEQSLNFRFLEQMYPVGSEFLFEKLCIAGGPLKELDLIAFENNTQDSKFSSLSIRDSSIDEFDMTPLKDHSTFREFEIQDDSVRSLDLEPYGHLHTISIELCRNLSSVILPKSDYNSVRITSCPLDKIDLTPLRNSPHMKNLILKGNRIKSLDLAPLFELWQLTELDLTGNPLDELDVTPLFNLFNLDSLTIPDDVSLLAQREASEKKIRNRGVKSIIDRVSFY
ncbi:MAG: hypothetical protein RTU30_05160 [Candidatus Thorarchaeota archaeon]